MNRSGSRKGVPQLNRKMTAIRVAALILLAAMTVGLFAGCAGKKNEAITSLDQLSKPGTKIGVMFDLLEFDMLKKDYPDAEIIAYSDNPLGYKDVANGRIDAYVYARREMELAIENGTEGVRLLEENYNVNPVAVGVSPKAAVPDLRQKLNAFIAEAKAGSGTEFAPYVVELLQNEKVKQELDFLLYQGRQNLYQETYLMLMQMKGK